MLRFASMMGCCDCILHILLYYAVGISWVYFILPGSAPLGLVRLGWLGWLCVACLGVFDWSFSGQIVNDMSGFLYIISIVAVGFALAYYAALEGVCCLELMCLSSRGLSLLSRGQLLIILFFTFINLCLLFSSFFLY